MDPAGLEHQAALREQEERRAKRRGGYGEFRPTFVVLRRLESGRLAWLETVLRVRYRGLKRDAYRYYDRVA